MLVCLVAVCTRASEIQSSEVVVSHMLLGYVRRTIANDWVTQR